MIKLKYTDTFKRWMRSLADRSAKARIIVRGERLVEGYSGDC